MVTELDLSVVVDPAHHWQVEEYGGAGCLGGKGDVGCG